MSRSSFDSGTRPLAAHHRYESANQNESEYDLSQNRGYAASGPVKRGSNKWIKIGIPVVVVAVIVVVLGIVLSTRHHGHSKTSTPSGGGGGGGKDQLFYTTTDAYGLPVYPSTVRAFLKYQTDK